MLQICEPVPDAVNVKDRLAIYRHCARKWNFTSTSEKHGVHHVRRELIMRAFSNGYIHRFHVIHMHGKRSRRVITLQDMSNALFVQDLFSLSLQIQKDVPYIFETGAPVMADPDLLSRETQKSQLCS